MIRGIDPELQRRALEPPRAAGAPLCAGTVREEPEDFLVEELAGFAPSGSGQHLLLKVRKRDANTQWVARELARLCGCRANEVGFAGLKDRHAVATQWFSVPRSLGAPQSWAGRCEPEFQVLEAHAHSRKLPRGALAGNRFEIRIRDVHTDPLRLAERAAWLRRRGVANYFGPQRFGNEARNLAQIPEDARQLRGAARGFVLSAARSLIFNLVLAERVAEESWDRLEPGDRANLDGRGSHFQVEALDEGLLERCTRLELHPTGPMWGRGELQSRQRIRELEMRIASAAAPAARLVEQAGMTQERRSTRLAIPDLSASLSGSTAVLRFTLARGGFATSVLREVFELRPP